MRRLAAFSYDRRRLVATLWVALIVLAGGLASGLGSGYVNNFTLPGTESQRALDLLRDRLPQQAGDTSQIVFHVQSGSLKDADQRARVQAVVDRVGKLPPVAGAVSPYKNPTATISKDGKTAYASLLFDRQAVDLDKAQTKRVIDSARAGATGGLEVELGGQAIQQAQQAETGAGELIGIGVAVIVLILVLGSFTAMAMPLISAFAAIAAAMGLVYAATGSFAVADFAPTLAVMIALGVGIDYALLVISRFRTERASGSDVREATLTAMDTAGRSVLFAGTTVVIALLGMLLLGVSFLNGPAVASAAAVALTMLSSLTLLPALLGFFGRPLVSVDNTLKRASRMAPHATYAKQASTPTMPSEWSDHVYTSCAGATPNDTTSASESISIPNALCVRVRRATRPSIMSKNIAKMISKLARYKSSGVGFEPVSTIA